MNSPTLPLKRRASLWWPVVLLVAMSAFAAGYSSVPALRDAVDKLMARVSDLRAQLSRAIWEKNAAEGARDEAERAKRLAESLAEQYQRSLAAAQADVRRLQAALDEANERLKRLMAKPEAPPAQSAEPPVDLGPNGQCPKCGFQFNVSKMLLDYRESVRCHRCQSIMSARRAVAWRDYVLSRQNRQR